MDKRDYDYFVTHGVPLPGKVRVHRARGWWQDTLLGLTPANPNSMITLPHSDRASSSVALARMHKQGYLFVTRKLPDDEFLIIRVR